jgi:hypothetical protein
MESLKILPFLELLETQINTIAGGMMISGTSNVRTKNLDLLENQSSVGAFLLWF